jgi:integrase/recombinase XerD
MPTKEYLEMDEAAQLEAVAVCLRDLALFRVTRVTGCRISEVLGINVDDIDFEHARVNIQHLKARINLACPDCGARLGKKHMFCPVCGKKVSKAIAKEKEFRRLRTIPIDQNTLQILRNYIKKAGLSKGNGHSRLFPMTRQRAWQLFIEAAQRAGLPDLVNPSTGRVHGVSPHKFRDAYAVNAVKIDSTGDGLRLLQEALGHQSITTTMKYRKVAGDELQAWHEKIFGAKGKAAE